MAVVPLRSELRIVQWIITLDPEDDTTNKRSVTAFAGYGTSRERYNAEDTIANDPASMLTTETWNTINGDLNTQYSAVHP